MEVTATSRRGNFATSTRDLHLSILKYERLKNGGIERRRKEGTELQSRLTQTSRKCPGFVPLFIFGIFSDIGMMFSSLNIFIFSFVMF